MADVFLSYGRSSLASARRISDALEASGFTVWFDEDLPAHRPYSDVIEEQLENAAAVIVLWSREAAQSQWVRSEANRARETGRLVQVRLDHARLPMPFDQIQCADLRGWRGRNSSAAWESVLASVGALANRDQADRPALPAAPADRRHFIAGGAAIASIALAGLAIWRGRNPEEPSPEAQLLIQKGMDALQQNDALDTNDPGSTLQAIALLTDATRAAPQSATAWGALAVAYAVRKRASPPSERAGLDSRSRSAARTALELDPNESRALGALRLLDPVYRRWLEVERADRAALKRNPTFPFLLFILSDMLGSVGRWHDAVEQSNQFNAKHFLIPGADRKVIVNLWAAGNLAAADGALGAAIEHWPDHPQIWRTRLAYLMYTGRSTETLELLGRESERPPQLSTAFLGFTRATAEALGGRRSAADAIRSNRDYLRTAPRAALQVVHACAALGAVESVFELLLGYYFGEGEWAMLAPPAGDEDRLTSPLFMPPMRSLWRLPQFEELVRRIGLTSYWSRSRSVPDYRRE